MSDQRTVLERLAGAKQSTDLSHKKDRCAVDYVGALGAAGIERPVGSALLDADLTHDRETVKRAYREAERLAVGLGRRRNWLMTPQKLHHITTEALRLYLAPACPTCKGRKFTGVDTAPAVAWKDCPICKGSGYSRPGVPCQDCAGKGRAAVKGLAKPYAPKACPDCHGTGKRPIPPRHQREVRELLTHMEAQRRAAGLAVRRQMGISREVEVE